jgi:hypothetical protein
MIATHGSAARLPIGLLLGCLLPGLLPGLLPVLLPPSRRRCAVGRPKSDSPGAQRSTKAKEDGLASSWAAKAVGFGMRGLEVPRAIDRVLIVPDVDPRHENPSLIRSASVPRIHLLAAFAIAACMSRFDGRPAAQRISQRGAQQK